MSDIEHDKLKEFFRFHPGDLVYPKQQIMNEEWTRMNTNGKEVDKILLHDAILIVSGVIELNVNGYDIMYMCRKKGTHDLARAWEHELINKNEAVAILNLQITNKPKK